MYLTLNENLTELTISSSPDLDDYDTMSYGLDIEAVKGLISELQDYVELMKVDEVEVKRCELLRMKADIEKQLSELKGEAKWFN